MRAPEFWTSDTGAAKTLAALLSPLSALYGLGARLSKTSRTPFRPRARVICVGNLTVGGSGKTPVAIALTRILLARGRNVVFLTRGYGGRLAGPVRVEPDRHTAFDVGDEPLLLARTAATIVARDRAAGAAFADGLGAEIIVLDDGHQNFSVAKDLSIVVVDGQTGFGNGRVIPAGPLREPAAGGLARADAIILMGDGMPRLPPFVGVVTAARLVPVAADALAGKSVFAFAGIGRPEKFYDMLRALGTRLSGSKSFADHHFYRRRELNHLRALAERLDGLLVTTEKDFVRIDPAERRGVSPVPVHAVFAERSAIDRLLDRLAPRSG